MDLHFSDRTHILSLSLTVVNESQEIKLNNKKIIYALVITIYETQYFEK